MSTTTSSDRPRSQREQDVLAALAQSGSAPVPALEEAPALVPVALSEDREPDRPGQQSTLGLRKFRDTLPRPSVVRSWQRPPGAAIRIRAELGRVRYHADLPATVAWTYEGELPGPTIEARSHHTVLVDWENALGDDPSPHRHGDAALPYDVVRVPPDPDDVTETIRIANQPGGRVREHDDHRHEPGAAQQEPPNAYPRLEGTDEIRAATVVHLHGALTDGHNDGWAHNVMLPGHIARCTYPNEQESATLWYHDHAMAVTRFNVFSGLAGLYLIRDEAEEALGLPSGEQELPIVIADRNLESEPGEPADFRPTGRLLYKQAGTEQDGEAAEIPVTGPFTMVNGKIWPTLDLEARWHRLRILNASNSRIYRLALYDTTDEDLPDTPLESNDDGGFGEDPDAFGMDRRPEALVVVGTEGGLLAEPHVPDPGSLEIGPGERLDVLVDLSAFRGRTVELRNENATVLNPQPGQIDATAVQLVVSGRPVDDDFRLPERLNPQYVRWREQPDGSFVVGPEPDRDRIEVDKHVWIGVIPVGTHGNAHPQMWELEDVSDLPEDEIGETDVIRLQQQGDEPPIVLRAGSKLFDDTVRILLAEDDWALWHIVHLGGPDHPMHIHMTTFQMVERRTWGLPPGSDHPGFDLDSGSTPEPLPVPDPGPEIDPVAAGTKETWVVKAGELVTVLGHFAGANGNFMYHCHILDHEDHTMMRPFVVLPPSLLALHGDHGGGDH